MPSERTSVPSRAGRRPCISIPTSLFDKPDSFLANSASRPRKAPLSHDTTHSRPASRELIPLPSSCPCSGRPASRRKVSRAPSPAGTPPACTSAFQMVVACATGTASSRPSSPVYPVPAMVQATPMSSSSLTRNRPTSAASREIAPITFRAIGPCTAMIARVFVVSTPPIASCTPVVLEALGMTSNTSSPTHHTMMSSNTQASFTSSKCVYCARPTEILFRSFVSAFCNKSNALSPETRTVPKCDTSNSAAP